MCYDLYQKLYDMSDIKDQNTVKKVVMIWKLFFTNNMAFHQKLESTATIGLKSYRRAINRP